jgi:triosephosphate isomerase
MSERSRKPIFAANWKMHKTLGEVKAFFDEFLPHVAGVTDREVMVAPSFIALERSLSLTSGTTVTIAAQNMFYETSGAFTGEISPDMLRDIGVGTVLLGHSERRHIFGESDKMIGKKLVAALSAGLAPVLCVGETLEERDAGRVGDVLAAQLEAACSGIGEGIERLVVAYEPVWAIGTGRTAGPEQAQDAHLVVRGWFEKHFETGIAERLRILYGGSVKPDNIAALMAMPDVDGVLVGGAALEAGSFASIVTCSI